MSISDPIIRTENLTRQFGDLTAVDRLNLAVPRGIIFGFLGPNGAGKSTTINMLTGLLPPTAGEAWVGGFHAQKDAIEAKRRIGVVPEGLSLYERLTATEQIELVARLHGLDGDEIARRIPPLLDVMELEDSADKMILDYSHGMRKKTALACALVHAPEVLFLDEPFEGIDPISTRAIKEILRDMVERRGTTVFFSTPTGKSESAPWIPGTRSSSASWRSSTRCSRSPGRCATRWSTPTRTVSSIVTSNRRTSLSSPTARPS